MSPFKKAKVILLPTGFIARRNEIGLQAYKTNLRIINNTEEEDLIFYQQHLYIISDDEIKKGDWVIEYQPKDNLGELHQIHNEYVLSPNIQKKVIATTDTTLELPRLSQQFIEEYIEEYNKGQQITECLVEYEEY